MQDMIRRPGLTLIICLLVAFWLVMRHRAQHHAS